MLPGMVSAMMAATGGGGGGGGGPVALSDMTVEHIVINPADAEASYTLNSSGSRSATGNPPTPWLISGAAADYDVSFDGGGSWFNLATSRSIAKTRTNIGITSQTYDVRVRVSATGVEVGRASITLYAEVSD